MDGDSLAERSVSLMRESLRKKFELYDESQIVFAHVNDATRNDISVGYRTTTTLPSQIHGTTYLDLQLQGNTCFLLNVGLDKTKRGNGFGWQLYEAVHEFARKAGVKTVRQTPSGETQSGKTRKEYLLERGYMELGYAEVVFAV